MHTTPLGKPTIYPTSYQSNLLFPIPRKTNRELIHIQSPLPFKGADVWNGYELSWLNAKGKPVVATAQFIFPCESPNLIESKSFKLYLNSFNQTPYANQADVHAALVHDLSAAAGLPVQVNLLSLSQPQKILNHFAGECLDHLDIHCSIYHPQPNFLITEEQTVTETVYSDLLKSNCPVTGQPDWGSIQISYTGKKIQHEGLLSYIISFRQHDEFHEQCVERIFMDITERCRPEKLLVYACYTRRGGLDINPWRASGMVEIGNERLGRQ